MSDRLLTSTEAAAWLSASPTSVKRWADAGLIDCVRTVGNHRRFTLDALERFAQTQGGEASTTGVGEWMTLLLERNVDAVQGQLLMERSVAQSWAEACDRLAPVLTQIGEAWATGAIRVVDEHLATERLARALARIVDAQRVAPSGPTAMLMTVAGDEHTLGLAFAEVVFREAGWRTLWSGRSTPIDELADILRERGVDVLAVSASVYSSDEAHLDEQLALLERACADAGCRLVIGGSGAWPDRATDARRTTSLRQLSRVISEITEEL
ncbi:MAG: helix-turn-helix domain-containing protein [Sandaracinaceae bacterium]|nr:helix-turn-helix domain-containing protein [Sandaracinaceae bacterium]